MENIIHTLNFSGIGETWQPLTCEIGIEEDGVVLYSVMGDPLYKEARPKLRISAPEIVIEALIQMPAVMPAIHECLFPRIFASNFTPRITDTEDLTPRLSCLKMLM